MINSVIFSQITRLLETRIAGIKIILFYWNPGSLNNIIAIKIGKLNVCRGYYKFERYKLVVRMINLLRNH